MTMTLHTKYRPSSFDEVIGQDHACASLERAIEKKSSQCFLLSGPSGCGKTTLARIAAARVGGQGRDITEIDAATFTGIDDMRAITQTLMYKPFGKNKRIYIVDECHMLSKAAWNSLLKATEEPPAWAFWFFCTTEPGRVPETIRTRCFALQLKGVSYKLLYSMVEEIAKMELIFPNKVAGKGYGIMELCAKEAGGSPRQALVNLGVCAAAKDKDTAAKLLRSAIESVPAKELATALMRGAGWGEVQRILSDLKEQNPESTRHEVRSYITAIIMNTKKEKVARQGMEVLDAFSEPFLNGDGMSPVVLAAGRVTFS